MTEEWLHLEADEAVEWAAHPRYMRAAPAIVASVALAAVAVAAAVVLEPLALAGLILVPIPAAYGYLRVVNTRFVVTNRAAYRKRGVLGVDVRAVELHRVQNTRSKRGLLGNVFGYGTVTVEVAGGPDLRFYDVYDPDEVRRLVERLGGTGDSVPGTAAQWRAVRDELRELRRLVESQPK